ncbi:MULTISPECIES: hypothetical protein [unclassified Pseudonocardia]|uniref:hypothetical protein n=1 Tax=unclassified Pseudonocardia TaxID=2619320 RepID=UPI00096927AA|nr:MULTISPECIES: hypothetical protein [unclassified Pseudonocardia]MBN9099762.1 hypothetical protein [Pseudonocardia sp.]OJY45255.1 MAG: hypothetical protein BGP03_15810 [Pseudonocardia sp. 73-21]
MAQLRRPVLRPEPRQPVVMGAVNPAVQAPADSAVQTWVDPVFRGRVGMAVCGLVPCSRPWA